MTRDFKYNEEYKQELIQRVANKLKDKPNAEEKDTHEREQSVGKVEQPDKK